MITCIVINYAGNGASYMYPSNPTNSMSTFGSSTSCRRSASRSGDDDALQRDRFDKTRS